MSLPLPCLRPTLRRRHPLNGAAAAGSHVRFFEILPARKLLPKRRPPGCRSFNINSVGSPENTRRIDPRIRNSVSENTVDFVESLWPRMPAQKNDISVKDFRTKYGKTQRGDTVEDDITIRGMQARESHPTLWAC